MCQVCAETVHLAALRAQVTLGSQVCTETVIPPHFDHQLRRVGTCVKYVPKQSIP